MLPIIRQNHFSLEILIAPDIFNEYATRAPPMSSELRTQWFTVKAAMCVAASAMCFVDFVKQARVCRYLQVNFPGHGEHGCAGCQSDDVRAAPRRRRQSVALPCGFPEQRALRQNFWHGQPSGGGKAARGRYHGASKGDKVCISALPPLHPTHRNRN